MAWLVQAGVLTGLCVSTSLPQLIGLKWYRQHLANYRDGKEDLLDSHTQALILKVMDSMNLEVNMRSMASFFSCFDNNPVHKGGAKLRSGAIIGLPPTFAYRSVDDVDREKLTVGADQTGIDWDSDSGRHLLESLVFSDKAKSFAIGREINYTLTNHFYTDIGLKVAFTGSAYTAVYYIEDLLQMRHRFSLGARAAVFSIVGSAFFILYLIGSDNYHCWRDMKVDRKTADISQDFLEGGLEFYERTLSRNRSIRQLMGDNGAKFYTVYGNEVATWRNRHMQYTARLDILKKYLAEIDTPSEQEVTAIS